MKYQYSFPREYYHNSLGVLETSLNELSAYRTWRKYDPGNGCPVDDRYAALPVLTKRDIRRYFPQGFVPPDRDVDRGLAIKEISFITTSGTSDVGVTNIWNQVWWDNSEKASWELNSYVASIATGKHLEAILANPRNVGFISDDIDLPMEKRQAGRFLFLNEKTNPATWAPALMDRMIDELILFQPVILEANPSLLSLLCRYAADKGIRPFQPGLIVFTYEYPSNIHVRNIRQVFTSPLASSYGTTETGYVFMQCETGKFHQNSRFCRVDFQPFKKEFGGPQLGRILVTTFNNPWFYIVRFDVGDLVRIDESGRCDCGRNSGMILSSIEGRVNNLTLDGNGHLVTLHELDSALAVIPGLEQYKLEQPARGQYILSVVSSRKDKESLSAVVTDLLHALYGKQAEISVVHETSISPESSGKYSLAQIGFPLHIEDYLEINPD